MAVTPTAPRRYDEACLEKSPASKTDADDDSMASSEDSNAAVSEKSRKRKRPTASLLKKAMEDLDKIWWDVPRKNNDNGSSSNNDDTGDDGEEHSDETEGNDNQNKAALIPNTHDLRELLPPTEMERVRQTTDLLVRVFKEDIHEPAVRALVANEKLAVDSARLQAELDAAKKEVDRLRKSEKKSRESIQNLLKAVGQNAEDTKDASQAKLVEAKMRADLLQARADRDSALKDSEEAKTSLNRLKEDVALLQKDKTKLREDKLRLETALQSARSLADSLSSSQLVRNSDNTDSHRDELDDYKKKAKLLESQLESMAARLVERNKEVQELRSYRDKHQSLQRLQALKKSSSPEMLAAKKRPRYSIKLTGL